MLRQYYSVKEAYPDAIVFFRLGDFYEMFEEDAVVAARELEIALTSREASKGKRIPMCGVPHHASKSYIARLIRKGHKVAICEQMEDPRQAKDVVRREVVRLITPGTVIDETSLDETENNYLAAASRSGRVFGLSFVDITTGEFFAAEIGGSGSKDDGLQRLISEISRIKPAEILLSPELGKEREILLSTVGGAGPKSVSCVVEGDAGAFDFSAAHRALTECLHTPSLDGFGLENAKAAVSSAGAVLSYLSETRKDVLRHVRRITRYFVEDHMILDPIARKTLEISCSSQGDTKQGSLFSTINRTVTVLGARLLRQWLEKPSLRLDEIHQRLEAVDELHADPRLRGALRRAMDGISDLDRLMGRIAGGTPNPRDLLALQASIDRLPEVRGCLESARCARLVSLRDRIDLLRDVSDAIARSISPDAPASMKEGGFIKPEFDPELDALREAGRDGRRWIASFEKRERERTGVRSLKVGFNKVFGYYIEVTRANLGSVPEDYERRQTLAGGERYVTAELKEKEALVLGAEERMTELEHAIFARIKDGVTGQADRLQLSASIVAELDVFSSLAEVAVARRYTKPEVGDFDEIRIKDGRHPVVECLLVDEVFVPNDILLDLSESQIVVLTGPNMAGKSTYLRQAALLVIMAQAGSFVPANRARIGLVDRIFTRVGAADDIGAGRSTFMVEMNEVANILNNATKRSLVILDEVGRGTSTFDGLSIAWAVTEYIHDHPGLGARTLFATHYHELTELGEKLERARNCRVAVRRDGRNICFLRKIVPGGADQSYGIDVARLAGLPAEVVNRARQILARLEDEKARAPRGAPAQLPLFEPEEHGVLQELMGLDVDSITPVQALSLLDGFRRKLLGRA
ncbi:MAG: DNA mismatch repair protein MutS [Firmicutes bacterium]|nr:DNA mismatch repair protein MutS [Bacillota bacterium]